MDDVIRKPFPKKLLNMVGGTYGHWKILSCVYLENKGKNANSYVKAECTCGFIKNIRYDSVLKGDSFSCGCSKGIPCGNKFPVKRTSDHILYGVWTDMNRRCYSSSRKDYKYYGGRGITICPEWRRGNKLSFTNFLKDMEETFEVGLEIERKDTDGEYCVDNCIWLNRKGQVNNTRVNRILKGYGVELTVHEWNHLLNTGKGLIDDRINKLSWSDNIEDLLKEDFKDRRYHLEYKGIDFTAGDLWKELGYNYGQRHKLVSEHGDSVKALRSEGVEFTILQERKKNIRTFEEGLTFLSEKGDDGFHINLLRKINEQRGDLDE